MTFLKVNLFVKSDNCANHGFSLTFFKVNLFAKATLRIEIMATATILNSYRFDPLLLTYKMEGELAGFACPPQRVRLHSAYYLDILSGYQYQDILHSEFTRFTT